MHFHNQSNRYQLQCKLHWQCTSTATALSQSIWQVSTLMQPLLTMHKHCHSTMTINPISIKFDATSTHYVQAVAQHFQNWFDQSQVWSNLDWLHTTTGKAVSHFIPSVLSLKQPQLTTYKQWNNTFTIDSICLKSEATLIDYIQPLAKQFHNRFHQSQVLSNLNSLCKSRGTTISQLIRSV